MKAPGSYFFQPGFLVVILLFTMPLLAQQYPVTEINPERLADELFPTQDLDLNYENLYENLLQILSNPIDLNRASAEDFRSLFILRENQVESLLAYRSTLGPFLSVYELQAVPEMDLKTLHSLMPFIKVIDASTTFDKSLMSRVLHEENNYLLTRYQRTLELKDGYKRSTDSSQRYAGSPDGLYFRFRTSRPGDFSFGATTEKDPGEAIRWHPQRHFYGMDYYSYHGQILNKGRVKNIILGDYQAQFGQGLIMGGGFGMGKSAETITAIRRSNIGFLPYTSLRESGFFRGAAISLGIERHLILHLFASRLRRDGQLAQDTTMEGSSEISSISSSGYHRTPSEIAARKKIIETNMGSVVEYRTKTLNTGCIYYHTDFSLPILPTPSLYNQFSFRGDKNENAGLFLNYTAGNISFFSELAQTLGQGKAIIAGLLGSLAKQTDISMAFRSFDRNFWSFYSNAIAENTIPQNETGMYWGFKQGFGTKYSLAGYMDLFRFPWIRYRGYAPSNGHEWLLRLNYQPSKTVFIFLQAREEEKIRNLSNEGALYQTDQGIKHNFWINADYAANRRLSFKTRLQWSNYVLHGKTTHGTCLIQDINVELGRFTISARHALFDTQDYDNRLYVYERDAWLAFSFPAYYGIGVRDYILLRWKVSRNMDFWIRWAHTHYADRDTIGTSGETIHGNVVNDIKLQAKFGL
jgi:Helix-hairpin-helix motif